MTTKNQPIIEVHWEVKPFNSVEMERWHYMWRQIFAELEKIKSGSEEKQ